MKGIHHDISKKIMYMYIYMYTWSSTIFTSNEVGMNIDLFIYE